MHIILDSCIYASDYRMKGVSFRTLFEYLRRTDSKLVLPRVVREEVVHDYGRRLKAESKEFAEVHNRYRYLDLDTDRPVFHRPDVQNAMRTLRGKLMKPADEIEPIYIGGIEGISATDVFMRGVQRIRPANELGEELRDVMIWLWVLHYCTTTDEEIAFISEDSTFWNKTGVHSQIDKDLQTRVGQLTLHRSVDEFIKQHAPAPIDATAEWVNNHLNIQTIERELLDLAKEQLGGYLRNMILRDLTLKNSEFVKGSVFQVAPDAEFAELEFKHQFQFVAISGPSQSQARDLWSSLLVKNWAPSIPTGSWGISKEAVEPIPGYGSLRLAYRSLMGEVAEPIGRSVSRTLKCEAAANFAIRAKGNEPPEVSITKFKIDFYDLQKELATKPKEGQ